MDIKQQKLVTMVHMANPYIQELKNRGKKSDLKVTVSPILMEFFRPLQELTKLQQYRVAQHILVETPKRMLPYPKIVLKHPRHMKLSTYHTKEWYEYMRRKTMTVKGLNKVVLEKQLVNLDCEVIWENWRSFKIEDNINCTFMTYLVNEATFLWLVGPGRMKRNPR